MMVGAHEGLGYQAELPYWLTPAAEPVRRAFDLSQYAYQSIGPGPWGTLQTDNIMLPLTDPNAGMFSTNVGPVPSPPPIVVKLPAAVDVSTAAATDYGQIAIGILAASGLVGLGYLLFKGAK